MNKSQAKEIAKKYIDRSTHVIVTADGNVFFQPQKNFAVNHSKRNNTELFSFTNEELGGVAEEEKIEGKKEEVSGNEVSFEGMTKGEIIEFCNEKGYPVGEYENLKTKKELMAYAISKEVK